MRSPYLRVESSREEPDEVGVVHIEGPDPYATLCGHLDRAMSFSEHPGPATCKSCVRTVQQVRAIFRRLRWQVTVPASHNK